MIIVSLSSSLQVYKIILCVASHITNSHFYIIPLRLESQRRLSGLLKIMSPKIEN